MSRRSAADKKMDAMREKLLSDIAASESIISGQQAVIDSIRRMLAQLNEMSPPAKGKGAPQ